MGKNEPKITLHGLKILGAFCDKAPNELSGADIRKLTGYSSGTVYPLLIRFEKAGWVASKWENINPAKQGRPRKRLYRITSLGFRRYQDETSRNFKGEPAWNF